MALTAFKGGIWLPSRPTTLNGSDLAYSNFLLDAASEQAAAIVQVPKSGTISKVGWRIGSITTGAILDVRLETISASTGDPTGTLWSANTNGAEVVVSGVDDNSWKLTTLTAGAAVTKGQFIAIVIANPIVSPGSLNINHLVRMNAPAFPYCDLFTASWAKSAHNPVIAFEYSDGSYPIIRGAFPFSSLPTISIDQGTTPDEIGVKFRINYTGTCGGFWMSQTANVNIAVVLYDSLDNQLASFIIDKDEQAASQTGTYSAYLFSSSPQIDANEWHRLTLVPGSVVTPDIGAIIGAVTNEATMGGLEGGTDFHLTQRTNAGAWTDTTIQRIYMGPIIDQIDIT